MNIDISDIRSFITVAELKSITAAANKLNYLQSNMTAKIKKIENHYKRQLFIRKPKGVELTESGMNLYDQYKKMLFTWEETENKIYQHEALIQFTQLGMGISMLAKSLIQKFNIQYYTEVPEEYRDIGLYLIARNDHVFTPIEKQFVGLNDQL